MPRSRSAVRRPKSRTPTAPIVFKLDGFDVPEQFSQVAADILAQKYFRKAGVARRLKPLRRNAGSLVALALGSR